MKKPITPPPQATHVAVPTGLWVQTITLIGKELTIEKGLDVYQALSQCKAIIGTPAPNEKVDEN